MANKLVVNEMETTASDITLFAKAKIGFLNEEKIDLNEHEKEILGFNSMNVTTWNQFKSVQEYSRLENELDTIFQKVSKVICIFHYSTTH